MLRGLKRPWSFSRLGALFEEWFGRKDLGQRGPGWEGGRVYLQEQLLLIHPASTSQKLLWVDTDMNTV